MLWGFRPFDGCSSATRTVESFALITIPLTVLLWGINGRQILASVSLSLVFDASFSIALAVVTWIQSMLLSTFLDRVDSCFSLPKQKSFIERLWRFELTRILLRPDWTWGWSASTYRCGSRWMPLLILVVYLMNYRQSKPVDWILLLLGAFPLLLFVTMGHTVRSVRHWVRLADSS